MLIIPKLKQEVTVIGEVQNTTSHFYRENLTRDDYIGLSGGTDAQGGSRPHLHRARRWQRGLERERRAGSAAARRWRCGPGDTIVVPLDTERMPALPLWQAVTQILYNLAIAAAAVNSF